MSSRGDLVSASFKHIYNFLTKIDDIKFKTLLEELNSHKVELTLTIFSLIGIMVQIKCFCLKVYLSLLGDFLSFCSNTSFLFSLVSTLNLSKDGE